MKVTERFSNIASYQGDNFIKWFGDMEYPKEVGIKLLSKKLPRSMNASEILVELKPTVVSIVDIYTTLESIDKSVWAIFYCNDVTGVLRAVRVYWDGGGWDVGAYSIGSPGGWRAGYRVFSRNSFDSLNSEPKKDINLADELKKIHKKLDKITKHLKIK